MVMGQDIGFLCEVSREAPKPSHKERLSIVGIDQQLSNSATWGQRETDIPFNSQERDSCCPGRPTPFQVSIQPLTHPFLTAEPSSVPILTGSFLMGPASLSTMPYLSPALSNQVSVSSHLYLEGAVQTSGMLRDRRKCEK